MSAPHEHSGLDAGGIVHHDDDHQMYNDPNRVECNSSNELAFSQPRSCDAVELGVSPGNENGLCDSAPSPDCTSGGNSNVDIIRRERDELREICEMQEEELNAQRAQGDELARLLNKVSEVHKAKEQTWQAQLTELQAQLDLLTQQQQECKSNSTLSASTSTLTTSDKTSDGRRHVVRSLQEALDVAQRRIAELTRRVAEKTDLQERYDALRLTQIQERARHEEKEREWSMARVEHASLMDHYDSSHISSSGTNKISHANNASGGVVCLTKDVDKSHAGHGGTASMQPNTDAGATRRQDVFALSGAERECYLAQLAEQQRCLLTLTMTARGDVAGGGGVTGKDAGDITLPMHTLCSARTHRRAFTQPCRGWLDDEIQATQRSHAAARVLDFTSAEASQRSVHVMFGLS